VEVCLVVAVVSVSVTVSLLDVVAVPPPSLLLVQPATPATPVATAPRRSRRRENRSSDIGIDQLFRIQFRLRVHAVGNRCL
jgi:hypothetical protein